VPLAGTDGTSRPFWSPDGRYLGFFAGGKLKKVDIGGGPPTKICDAPTGSDGTWSPEGVILYDGTGSDPIQRVAAAGGTPVVAVKQDASRKETQIGWPAFLPDGRHFIYMAINQKVDESAYRIGALDSTETKAFAPAQTMLTYADPGYLLFVRDRTLVAQRFDAKAMKSTGEPVPLAEQIGTDAVGLARFSVSRDGVLAFRTGESGNRLVWLDRSGKELSVLGEPGEYAEPSLSANGERLAFGIRDPRAAKEDVWIRDLARGVNSRFTFAPGNNYTALWSPDAQTIVFASDRDGAPGLYAKASSGQGDERLLLKTELLTIPRSFSPDGRLLAYNQRNPKTGWDVFVVPMTGEAKPIPFATASFNELSPEISPDGRYLAYQSNESGRAEIYAQSFPGPSGKWQISNTGGMDPHWRADGKELYYRAPDSKLMAVDIRAGDTLEAGIPKPLFLGQVHIGNARNKFVPAADGQRFLFAAPLGRESMTPTTVVLNWFAGLGK
jgi:Tol biopolymer transport system component